MHVTPESRVCTVGQRRLLILQVAHIPVAVNSECTFADAWLQFGFNILQHMKKEHPKLYRLLHHHEHQYAQAKRPNRSQGQRERLGAIKLSYFVKSCPLCVDANYPPSMFWVCCLVFGFSTIVLLVLWSRGWRMKPHFHACEHRQSRTCNATLLAITRDILLLK